MAVWWDLSAVSHLRGSNLSDTILSFVMRLHQCLDDLLRPIAIWVTPCSFHISGHKRSRCRPLRYPPIKVSISRLAVYYIAISALGIIDQCKKHNNMSEHRVRPARHKGQLNFEQERNNTYASSFAISNASFADSLVIVIQALYAFGDDKNPLPETIRVLDEIVTDYIIETVHTASKAATISGRGKAKVDDFKFAIRNDEVATGRVKELLTMEKSLKDARKQFDTGEGKVGLERGGRARKKKIEQGEMDVEAQGAAEKGKRKRKFKQEPSEGEKEDDVDGDEDMD